MALFRLGPALQIQFGHSHIGCCNFGPSKAPENKPPLPIYPSYKPQTPTHTTQTPPLSSAHAKCGKNRQTIGSIGHGCQGLKLSYLWHAMHCNFYFNLLTRKSGRVGERHTADTERLLMMASRCQGWCLGKRKGVEKGAYQVAACVACAAISAVVACFRSTVRLDLAGMRRSGPPDST